MGSTGWELWELFTLLQKSLRREGKFALVQSFKKMNI